MRPSPQKHYPILSPQMSQAPPPLLLQGRPAIPIFPGGRGMDDPKRSAAAAPSLPDDALVEILSRVPAKSLCRFKCVSKAWCDLIADRLRCKRLPQTLEGFFYAYDGDDDEEIHGGDCDDGSGKGDGGGGVSPGHVARGRFINTLGRFVPLASYSFLLEQLGVETICLMRSCNGLLLFGHRRDSDTYDSLGYIVCNPATEQWVAVPSSGWKPFSLWDWDESEDSDSDSDNESSNCRFTYLIFDPAVSAHFQLVEFWSGDAVCVEEVHTYSSETGVWCKKTSEWSSDEAVSFFAGSAFVSGMLHFSVTNFDTHQEQIVAVDGEGKRCRIIVGPEKSCDAVFIGQSKGCLHYLSRRTDSTSKMTELSIWVLQEYNTEDWVLKHRVTFLQLFGRMSCRDQDYNVVAIHPDRDLIFFLQHWDLQLKSYDMDSKEVCTLRILRVGPQHIFPYVPYFAESTAVACKH
ncbi:hypothetical protein SETIT_3G396500v2 [Setaria italica]|uniref:F-box domain-containing protein n=1 Tax=Setaria italica TaxID=4555 RepID=A0A368QNW1_SETIT|nr:uncharacterized protein LOC101753905 [Setaria italica]RCV19572.1 hypothetical protein SETIT_3G396500v2 [Setaria italica]